MRTTRSKSARGAADPSLPITRLAVPMPAMFITMRGTPNFASAASSAAPTESLSATSHLHAMPPNSPATRCAPASLTSSTATLAPAAASARAVASPSPEPPPVTIATCPWMFICLLSGCRLSISARRLHPQHDRHRRVARGAAGEQTGAAAAQHQLLDQLDHRAQAGRALRMAPDQRRAVVVHLVLREAGLARERDVVDRERVVGLDRGDVLHRQTRVLQGVHRRGRRRHRHVALLDPRLAEAEQLDLDRTVLAQFARQF